MKLVNIMNNLNKSSIFKFKWKNTALNTLVVEDYVDNEPRQVPGVHYSRVETTPVENPRIVSLGENALNETLDLTKDEIMENEQEWAEILAGNTLLEGSEPIAHGYGGHQFGVFAGQLGDGRAITLGDIENSKGQIWELQLKGAGKTPYSRFADGRAVLRSSIREYLCSEHINALGIPTTRAASLITSDTTVVRDILYDGHPINENGAILLRLAPTFIRFGSFQTCLPIDMLTGTCGPSLGMDDELIPKLLEYSINHLKTFDKLNMYTDLAVLSEDTPKSDLYLEAFKEITIRTAYLVARWQGAGFGHGVLNTDNMSILGLTIDYGPFGFMEHFDPDHICNHSDKDRGRYTYKNQPSMGKWNLFKLAQALAEYIPDAQEYVEQHFDLHYTTFFMNEFKDKLGIRKLKTGDLKLIQQMYGALTKGGYDWTNFFRYLYNIPVPQTKKEAKNSVLVQNHIDHLFEFRIKKAQMGKRKKSNLPQIQLEKLKEMIKQNPNLLKLAGQGSDIIQKELNKDEEYSKLLQTEESQIDDEARQSLNEWIELYLIRLFEDFEARDNANEAIEEFSKIRADMMLSKNPKFILRNHLADECIKQAESGDYSMLKQLLYVLEHPFNDHEEMPSEWSSIPPPSAQDLCVSCSS